MALEQIRAAVEEALAAAERGLELVKLEIEKLANGGDPAAPVEVAAPHGGPNAPYVPPAAPEPEPGPDEPTPTIPSDGSNSSSSSGSPENVSTVVPVSPSSDAPSTEGL